MKRFQLLFAAAFLSIVGCGDEKGAPGESCVGAGDCESALCETGGSFPGGVCTIPCDGDADCPAGFRCISRSSGICLEQCADTDECEASRGQAWQCREESLEEGGVTLLCASATENTPRVIDGRTDPGRTDGRGRSFGDPSVVGFWGDSACSTPRSVEEGKNGIKHTLAMSGLEEQQILLAARSLLRGKPNEELQAEP